MGEGKEILWHIVNSMLAGALIIVGAFASGNINLTALLLALITGFGVAISKFKDFWATQLPEYENTPQPTTAKAFNFF